jgi:uncharacterized membrane protein
VREADATARFDLGEGPVPTYDFACIAAWRRDVNWRVVIGLLAFLIGLATKPAEAGYRVCNNSSDRLNIAFGYVDRNRGWTAEGWWAINPAQCSNVHQDDLDNRYYYVLAEPTEGGPPWKGGTVPFCVSEKSFRIYQEKFGKSTQDECVKAGYRSALFIVVDVGQGQKNHLHNFGTPTSPTAAAPQQQQPPVATAPPPQPPVAAVQPPRPQPQPQPQPQPPVATGPRPAPPAGNNPNGAACQRYPNLC